MVDDNRVRTVAQRQGVALDFGVEMEVRVAAVLFDVSCFQRLLPQTQGRVEVFDAGDNGSVDSQRRTDLIEQVESSGVLGFFGGWQGLGKPDEPEIADAHLELAVLRASECPDARRGRAHGRVIYLRFLLMPDSIIRMTSVKHTARCHNMAS